MVLVYLAGELEVSIWLPLLCDLMNLRYYTCLIFLILCATFVSCMGRLESAAESWHIQKLFVLFQQLMAHQMLRGHFTKNGDAIINSVGLCVLELKRQNNKVSILSVS